MKRIKKRLILVAMLFAAVHTQAQETVVRPETDPTLTTLQLTVNTTRYQRVTGFGAAACFGLMEPIQDPSVIDKLYGPDSKVGLNILRMEISPNMVGDVKEQWWDTPYDWHGYLPVTKRAKELGAIVFGTPWSPPAIYKTNNSASGGQVTNEDGTTSGERGKLKTENYKDFFPWLNTFLTYMSNNGVNVDAVALQNEPDWWVPHSGCLYEPAELHELVLKYAKRLNKSKFGVKIIGGESLCFDTRFTDALLDDPETAKHIEILGGHIYGNPPLKNMKTVATKGLSMGKETWMTEHSFDPRGERPGDERVIDLPTWHEELLFAEELNESMLANASAYIYWYMIAHWSFIGSGEQTLQPGNEKGKLLRRGLIMSHFAKHLPGATRLGYSSSAAERTNAPVEFSSYIKGDSLIVLAIDTLPRDYNLKMKLPYKVKGGKRIQSTEDAVVAEATLDISEPSDELTFRFPGRSLSTYIFTIDNGTNAIETVEAEEQVVRDDEGWYNMKGQRVENPKGGVFVHRGKKIVR